MAFRDMRGALVASVAVCAVAVSSPALAQSKQFDVPAQSASTGIPELARQADIQILASESAVRGKRTRAVNGKMSVEQAIRRLIAGTGLRIVSGDGRTYTLAIDTSSSRSDERNQMTSVPEDATDEEIVVTGTNIRGADKTLPLIVVRREDIERSGYSTTQQYISSLPQNFSGGDNGASEEGFLGNGATKLTNITRSTGINLRGLGSGATLVLVDGQRLAASGQGSVVDVNLIPVNVIERIDILTDSSSAIYGSDAVAGVVNFITRAGYDGGSASITAGTVTNGSMQEYTLNGSQGFAWNSGDLLVSGQYRTRDNLDVSERSFSNARRGPFDILPGIKQWSLFASARQSLGIGRLSLKGLYTDQNSKFQYCNATGTRNCYEQVSDSGNISIAGKLDLPITNDLNMTLSGSYSSENTTMVQNNRTVPLAGYVSGDLYFSDKYNVWSFDNKFDGALFKTSGGDVKFALGATYRNEYYRGVFPKNSPGVTVRNLFDRDIFSAYGEISVPLVSQANRIPLVEEFNVSAAVRYDHYSDFGTTVNPRIGVAWKPAKALKLRASYSESFRAPNANESTAARGSQLQILTYRVTSSSGGTEPIFLLYNSSELGLAPERARTFSAGTDLNFGIGSSGRVDISANYFNIRYTNRIVRPPFDVNVLLKRDQLGALIQPIADDAAALAFWNRYIAAGATYIDYAGGTAGIRNVYVQGVRNAASVKQSGMDFQVRYRHAVRGGSLSAAINATYLFNIDTAYAVGADAYDQRKIYGAPTDFRARGTLGWSDDLLDISSAANFVNGYKDTTVFPEGRVDDFLTFDLTLRTRPKFLRGLSLGLSAINIFGRKPPYVGGFDAVHYDPANASALGRFISLTIKQDW